MSCRCYICICLICSGPFGIHAMTSRSKQIEQFTKCRKILCSFTDWDVRAIEIWRFRIFASYIMPFALYCSFRSTDLYTGISPPHFMYIHMFCVEIQVSSGACRVFRCLHNNLRYFITRSDRMTSESISYNSNCRAWGKTACLGCWNQGAGRIA